MNCRTHEHRHFERTLRTVARPLSMSGSGSVEYHTSIADSRCCRKAARRALGSRELAADLLAQALDGRHRAPSLLTGGRSRAIVLCFAGVLSRGFKMSERCWRRLGSGRRSCNDSLVYIGGKLSGLVRLLARTERRRLSAEPGSMPGWPTVTLTRRRASAPPATAVVASPFKSS